MFLIHALIGALGVAAASLVGRVLLALGLSFVTYTGVEILMGTVMTSIRTNMSGMPASALSFLAYMWIDRAITMIFSAYTAAMFINMAGASKITRLVTKA